MTIQKKPLSVILIIAVLIALSVLYSARIIKQGADAYVFGFPLVLMELTRQAMESDAEPGRGPNHLQHLRIFPDHTFRNVVRPNNDTLYSIVWFDLSKEPMVISTPRSDRYYVLPFMDAWTNVFASIGTRTTGNEPGNFALVGPNWQGNLPTGVEAIQSPTNMVWMIGRVQANGQDDVPNVAAIQDQIAITPVSRWEERAPYVATVIESFENTGGKRNPKAEIDALSAAEFFSLLSKLMGEQPASVADQAALENLAEIGVVPGQPFDMDALGFLQGVLIKNAVSIANSKLHKAIDSQSENPTESGWAVWRDTIGQFGSNYKVRAGVAMGGLGALPPGEAAYPSTSIDNQGVALVGSNRYKIHFPAGQTPPAKAFWSLTMYDVDGFMLENPINRYVIGDRDPLTFNDDGSLDIYIQNSRPQMGETNWLPAPADRFTVLMRIYSTKESFLSGAWKVPAIERIN